MLRRRNEQWMVDLAIRLAGLDSLWIEMMPAWLECGHRLLDIQKTNARIRSLGMMSKEWERTARLTEEHARAAEEAGHRVTAGEFYHRAALYYGRAKWPIFDDTSPRKRRLSEQQNACFDKVIAYNDLYRLERVEIPFEGRSLAGILHHVPGPDRPPCVIFAPGMDMTKEDFPNVQNNIFVRRGLACLSIDGPGQGESNLRGIKAELDNYERAVSAAVDFLQARGDVDGERLALLGLSLGGYWSVRAAAAERRLKAHVSMIGIYGSLDSFLNVAPPTFRHTFMYMAGLQTDEAMDAMGEQMSVLELAARIHCPTLLAVGEYDQLSPHPETLAFYDRLAGPKELWVYEGEFHAMGARRADLWPQIADWITTALAGCLDPGYARTVVVPER